MSDIQIPAVLLNLKRQQFADKATGELVRMASVTVYLKPDAEDQQVTGYQVQTYRCPWEVSDKLVGSIAALIGKPVSVGVCVKSYGKALAFEVRSITGAGS